MLCRVCFIELTLGVTGETTQTVVSLLSPVLKMLRSQVHPHPLLCSGWTLIHERIRMGHNWVHDRSSADSYPGGGFSQYVWAEHFSSAPVDEISVLSLSLGKSSWRWISRSPQLPMPVIWDYVLSKKFRRFIQFWKAQSCQMHMSQLPLEVKGTQYPLTVRSL